uniref:BTB domain-containing protein n=1 Tax=Branchiostoma floridae TaxID=7739 RepID=C3Z702_BRAFL|eukprot:XP_002595586.1 hypothetical protein BRAFLDRAFT_117505 [Branchiostoma floridae]
MADENAFYGTWIIEQCVSLSGRVEPTGIEGTEFKLDENGDVIWKVSDDAEPMPFFSCEAYEVILGDPAVLRYGGTSTGDVIAFKADFPGELPGDHMVLTYEKSFILQCRKMSPSDQGPDSPYSLLSALEEGYFSDVSVKADDGTDFKIHKIIAGSVCPSVDWTKSPCPLTGQSKDVIYTVLHYVYCESLPSDLTEDVAKLCVRVAGKVPGLEKFVEMCQTFVDNSALKQQIIGLITDVHTCADRIIEIFTGRQQGVGGLGDTNGLPAQSHLADPAKLCYAVKQALREAAVAGTKVLLMCDIFNKRKWELSRQERHDIIKYAHSRLPIFLEQLQKLLRVVRNQLGCLTTRNLQDIAVYLVPEIDQSFQQLSSVICDAKGAVEQALTAANKDDHHKHKKNAGDFIGRTLKNALHMKELMKLRRVHDRITSGLMVLINKREHFDQMTQEEKTRSVVRSLEQCIEEVPVIVRSTEELARTLDERITWREWKYIFKLGTSELSWALSKMATQRSSIEPFLQSACELVHRDPFTQTLIQLSLLGQPCKEEESSSDSPSKKSSASPVAVRSKTTTHVNYKLSCVESLTVPPSPKDSHLARRMGDVLHTRRLADMTFHVIYPQDVSDLVIDHSAGGMLSRTDDTPEVEEIHAHRVIVAARCDWFRRALLSGMKEAIDRRITVHDTSPALFRLFLEYLYVGNLATDTLTLDQLADMTALSDRYEVDSLKRLCEGALQAHLEEDTALFLLGLADQFGATSLKSTVMDFILDHPNAVEDIEVFSELPEQLQEEVEDMLAWSGHVGPFGTAHPTAAPPSHLSGTALEDMACALSISDEEAGGTDETTSSDLSMTEDRVRLDACLSALRDIVGDDVPQEELVRVSLAADYDVNRALNFFFSS